VRQHVTPPNLVTSVSLAAGFLALLVAADRVALAAGLVLLAAVLDVVDGALARRAGGDRTFGAQLDSLTDLLCFCVVPAFTVHQAVSVEVTAPALLVSGGFVLAGAWRLARFPLVRQQAHFVGLPTPAAGCLVMLLALWAPPVPALIGAALLGALMVSTVRFPTVLAAAATVRPGRPGRDTVDGAPGHEAGGRPREARSRLVRRVFARRSRPGTRRPARRGRQRAAERAGRVLRALRSGRPRRWGRR